MSAGRRYGRTPGWRFEPRAFDHEMSAATRQRVADLIVAHDDPAVTVTEFLELARDFMAYLAGVGDLERQEAAIRVSEHCTRAVTGRPNLHAVGWLVARGRR